MMIQDVPPTVFGVAAILCAVAVLSALALRAGHSERLPAIGLIAIFAGITQLPLPPSEGLDCSDSGEPPLLRPLRFVDAIGRRLERNLSALEWLRELTISSTALNLHACIVIGVALGLCVARFRAAILIGAAMSLTAETAQITGLFGLYDCTYRQFEVDDLILNTSGVAIGYALARMMRAGRVWRAAR
ncbi:hypothetical protein OCH239_12715 [Roseivivax halodurans JCM 10272]|uniref:VanZ-like domain-containing protein n=1 Tax=Roseivivax halodurans JCM 10272 TaxID=1449350 RepID=X7EAW8_9RHOB|nr:VanZ family protein [Roseivivax halodurans]ETX13234.1 hypothetical protein OCH239_12715 [Roseivivax halodurans JCM 10272]